MMVTVDIDILNSLKGLYFGDFSDPIKAASDRAYRDMNRTITFEDNCNTDKRHFLRKSVTKFLKEKIPSLDTSTFNSPSDYDNWHAKVCEKLIKIYKKQNISLTYGQAQKWLNMTIKYLYLLGEYSFDNVFNYLHVPIDRYIIKIAKDRFNIGIPADAWSTWDYDSYINYQEALRKKIENNIAPLKWEFTAWLESARNIKKEW